MKLCVRAAGLRQVLADVIQEVRRSVSQDIDGAEILHGLLNAPWLQSLLKALLSAHDTVAQKDYEPVLPPMPEDLPEDEEATRIVCLVKNKQPLGATIKRNEITGEIFVARVIHGGLADRSGLLHAGDRIVEVNGFPVDGMEPEQVIQVQARSHGTIMFKVIPITERPVHNQTMLYMRAMTDYSPQQDPNIPCADAGISFKKGDVLEIVDQTDALWWQAKKLPSSVACAGLIPSTNLLKRKQREFWWSQPYQPHFCIDISIRRLYVDEIFFCGLPTALFPPSAGFRRSMRLCRRRAHSTIHPSCPTRCPSSCYSALNSPYEEVVRYQRHPEDVHRLIAILGPSGVGVSELRRRLIEMNPNIFHGAVPHTTRPPRGYEESGREYYFTSREAFDNMVYNNRLLEYGEYKGNLYGTSIESARHVLNSGKICVIDIEPNAIQAVRTHELKAYIIYVKPPPLERLRETRRDSYITTDYYVNRPFKDEDLQEMEEAARKMESQYWQFFDHVLINDELQDSCVQLLTAVRQAQDEPQWVPASWIRPTAEP
uniref:Membrane protein, palmitoylated 4-like n=1 Tax=Oryzias latipes TaxID=8090 RepID=A0A3P9I4D0_ORYLA